MLLCFSSSLSIELNSSTLTLFEILLSLSLLQTLVSYTKDVLSFFLQSIHFPVTINSSLILSLLLLLYLLLYLYVLLLYLLLQHHHFLAQQDMMTTAAVERRAPDVDGEHMDKKLSPKAVKEGGARSVTSMKYVIAFTALYYTILYYTILYCK